MCCWQLYFGPACLPAMEMGGTLDWENKKIKLNAEIQLSNQTTFFMRKSDVLTEYGEMGHFDISDCILLLGICSVFLFCFRVKPRSAEDLTLNFTQFLFSDSDFRFLNLVIEDSRSYAIPGLLCLCFCFIIKQLLWMGRVQKLY